MFTFKLLILSDAIAKRYESSSESDITDALKRYLRGAGDRQGGKRKRSKAPEDVTV